MDPDRILPVLSVLGGIVILYVLVHLAVTRYLPRLNRWLGAALANLPVIAVFVVGLPGGPIFGLGEGAVSALTYGAAALLVAGIRADGGCEVMSVPGLLFGQRTHLACILFSPIDWVEERISGG